MAWSITGRYMETCNCDYLCPCIITGMAESTHGNCIFAMAFSVESGRFNNVEMGGSRFLVIGRTPGNMGEGNWEVGVIVDESASSEQVAAIGAIISGQAGGPMANLAPLLGKFLGIEKAPIEFKGKDGSWSVVSPGILDEGVEGARGLGGEFIQIENVPHPANNILGVGRATHSRLHALGIDWEDASGRNNGHFAPFNWSGS